MNVCYKQNIYTKIEIQQDCHNKKNYFITQLKRKNIKSLDSIRTNNKFKILFCNLYYLVTTD